MQKLNNQSNFLLMAAQMMAVTFGLAEQFYYLQNILEAKNALF